MLDVVAHWLGFVRVRYSRSLGGASWVRIKWVRYRGRT